METARVPPSVAGPSRKNSSPWVAIPSPSSTPPDATNITFFDPSPELERQNVRTYAMRLETFTSNRWNAKLCKSKTCCPEKMAEIGWFCTGPDSAKCYACFKDLEGWEPKDTPKEEHEKHCPKCPLVTLNIQATSVLTLREQIRLDTAIEFFRKKLICRREWTKLTEFHQEQHDKLREMIVNAKKTTISHDESLL